MSNPTITGQLIFGAFTISGVSGQVGNTLFGLLGQVIDAAVQGTANISEPNPTSIPGTKAAPIFFPSPSAGSGYTNVLVVPAQDQGVISVGSGWNFVLYDGPGQILPANGEVVIGDLNVGGPRIASGAATIGAYGPVAGEPLPPETVFGAGGVNATIGLAGLLNDSAPGALIAIASGNYNVIASGAGQQVQVGNPGEIQLDLTGDGSTLQLGQAGTTIPAQQRWFDNVTIGGAGDSITMAPLANAVFNVDSTASNTSFTFTGSQARDAVLLSLNGDGTTVQGFAGNLNIDNIAGGTLTYNGTGAKAQIYDTVGGAAIVTGSSGDIYENAPGGQTSTIVGGTGGHDTVYAFTGVDYAGGHAASTFFVGSTDPNSGANTVNAGSNATIFGGAAGGAYTIGGGSFFFEGAQGTAGTPVVDRIEQTSLSGNATIYASSNDRVTLDELGSGGSPQATLFAAGTGTAIDATGAAGGDTFFIDSLAQGSGSLPGAVTGASTLTGATAGREAFTLFIDNSTEAAHTVVIANWQSSDSFTVVNDGGSGAFLPADLNSIAAFNAGSATSFTLNDGTTISFTGTVPHNIATG